MKLVSQLAKTSNNVSKDWKVSLSGYVNQSLHLEVSHLFDLEAIKSLEEIKVSVTGAKGSFQGSLSYGCL